MCANAAKSGRDDCHPQWGFQGDGIEFVVLLFSQLLCFLLVRPATKPNSLIGCRSVCVLLARDLLDCRQICRTN